MSRTIRNHRNYRVQDINVGDFVTVEKSIHIGELKDINGDIVKVNGVYELFGTVTNMYAHHCSVICGELHFDNGKIIIPIKKENQFTSSINYWNGNANVQERRFVLESNFGV